MNQFRYSRAPLKEARVGVEVTIIYLQTSPCSPPHSVSRQAPLAPVALSSFENLLSIFFVPAAWVIYTVDQPVNVKRC